MAHVAMHAISIIFLNRPYANYMQMCHLNQQLPHLAAAGPKMILNTPFSSIVLLDVYR
jgi:hypothetical protein